MFQSLLRFFFPTSTNELYNAGYSMGHGSGKFESEYELTDEGAIYVVLRKYGMDGGDPVCAYTSKADADAMCAKLTELMGDWLGDDDDPPFGEDGKPRMNKFKRFVIEQFGPYMDDQPHNKEAYDLLMTSANKFHQTDFEVKKVSIIQWCP